VRLQRQAPVSSESALPALAVLYITVLSTVTVPALLVPPALSKDANDSKSLRMTVMIF